MMTLSHWVFVAAFCFSGCCFFYYFLHLLRKKTKKDLSLPKGSVAEGIGYSYTVAMMPNHKESAYLHIPTYTAGILFHIASFLSLLTTFFIFVIMLLSPPLLDPLQIVWVKFPIIGMMAIGIVSGLSVLFKRVFSKSLRRLSTPDDYLSNLMTVSMQLATLLSLLFSFYSLSLWVTAVILVYMPFGKLKHVFYFFAARIELGIFYGHRGVWKFKQ